MTKEELAKAIDGTEYPVRLDAGTIVEARRSELVIVYGESDDLMEFEGAIQDEVGCFKGGSVRVDKNGLVPDFDSIDHDDKEALRNYFKRENSGTVIEALWCKESGYSWTYKTTIPHATFEVMEDGEHYCRGIVFDLQSCLTNALPTMPYTGVTIRKAIAYCSYCNKPVNLHSPDGECPVAPESEQPSTPQRSVTNMQGGGFKGGREMTDLSDLKVGDTVVHHYAGWGDIRHLYTVSKIGKKFINISGRAVNFRFSGSSVGHTDGRIERFSQPGWDAYCQAIKEKEFRRKLRNFDWCLATDAVVRQVHALLFGRNQSENFK